MKPCIENAQLSSSPTGTCLLNKEVVFVDSKEYPHQEANGCVSRRVIWKVCDQGLQHQEHRINNHAALLRSTI